MKSKRSVRWIAGTAILLAGCATTRPYPAPPLRSAEEIVEISGRPAAVEATPNNSPGPTSAFPPRNILVLSGGGMNGAYTAGVLKGWTESGTRPQFDVVTGISTGALVAPYAFLGSQFDAELESLYLSIRQGSVFRPRLVWLDSVASSEPLKQQIAASATPDVLVYRPSSSAGSGRGAQRVRTRKSTAPWQTCAQVRNTDVRMD
jgi:hypothetical protein